MQAPENNTAGPTVYFDAVARQEQEWLALRRQQVDGKGYGKPSEDSAGLGLSGGGIRSAIFNLGLLQSLELHGVMSRLDYLSTVSGGGYIGACRTWLKSLSPNESPFGTSRRDYKGRAGEVLAWLRSHGKYLTAGEGLSGWSLAAAVFTAVFANLLVIVPALLLLFYLLTRQVSLPPAVAGLLSPIMDITPGGDDGFAIMLVFGVVSLALFLFLVLLYMSATALRVCQGFVWQRNMRRIQGKALMYGVLFVVAGTVPLFHQYVVSVEGHIVAGFVGSEKSSLLYYLVSRLTESTVVLTIISGALSLLAASRSRRKQGASASPNMLLVNGGLSLLIYGMFLLFYELMKEPNEVSWTPSLGDFPWFWYSVLFSAFLAIFGNVNLVSMHRYYRNRLMEAFMPVLSPTGNSTTPPRPDCHLVHKQTPDSDAPYHIINAAVNMVGSDDTKRQGRGGDNFVFTPLYCGAESTGYIPTNQYVGNTMDLATAIAISGAAVNPNSYATRSRPVSFLMTLLNLRLGYWIRNPRYPAAFNGLFSRPWWYLYMLREMFGNGLNERRRHIHLADGGHFENLGLYELVRRRCRFIIISDAAADPQFGFSDLAKAIEMVRVDFGAKVTLATDDMIPTGEKKLARRAFSLGTVKYIDRETPARLIYIKTTLTEGLPEDLYAYRRANPAYPDESTADQFFGETQFEAYRELGFQIGEALCAGETYPEMESFFAAVEERSGVDEAIPYKRMIGSFRHMLGSFTEKVD